jgi:hypothetical protein
MAVSCRNIAENVANGRLAREELDTLMERLEAERAALEGLDNVESRLMDAGRIILEDLQLAKAIEKRNRLKNVLKYQELTSAIDLADAEAGDPSLGLRARVAGVNTPFLGSSLSVDAKSNALYRGFAGQIIVRMRDAGLEQFFYRMPEDMQREVSRALYDLSLAEPRGVDVSPQAKKIAEIMNDVQGEVLRRLNRSGAFIRERQGYITRQSHDALLMRREGKEAWVADIRQRLDFEAMRVTPERVDDYLSAAYDNLVSGIRLADDGSPIEQAFRGPSNLAKRASASRELIFKGADEWFDYNARFGMGSMNEAFFSGLNNSAKTIALMDIFGPNPRAMFDRVMDYGKEKYKSDEKKLNRFSGGIDNLEHMFAEVEGSVNWTNSTAQLRAAGVLSAFRAIQSFAKLGGAVISALPDLGIMASTRIYHGRSLMDAWNDTVTGMVQGIAPGEQRRYAELAGVGLEGYIGGVLSRFEATDNFTGKMHKAMSVFFRLNLLSQWTDASKRGQALVLLRDFGMSAETPFGGLRPEMQRLLTIYGITSREWDVARLATTTDGEGRVFFAPGDIDNVRGAPFVGLTQSQQQRLRDEVRDKFMTLMAGEMDTAVLTAGARERAILRRGTQPGTATGEALRLMAQFKSFPTAVLSKIMGRHIYGSGYRSIGEAGFAAARGENMGLVNFMVASTVLGYFSMQLKEIAKGRSPRPASSETFIAAFLQGGGAGIYGDFLFGQANRFGNNVLETVAGPGIGAASDAIQILQRIRGAATGGDDTFGGDAIRFVQSNTPFANLFYIKGALDYLLWYQMQEMVNPGYLQRMERRIEQENNQTFYIRPSDIVARGGGFQ